jgi:hypothetical protein
MWGNKMYLPKEDLRDTAQVCLNGHLVSPASTKNPIYNKRYCEQCSASTVTSCQNCAALVKGPYPAIDGKEPDGTETIPGFYFGASVSRRTGTVNHMRGPSTTVTKYKDVPSYEVFEDYQRPNFCGECGQPYPWTTASVEAAQELVAEDENLSEVDKASLDKDLPALVSDTPQTPAATERVRKVLEKAGNATADGLSKILVGVITEAAKKALFPGP